LLKIGEFAQVGNVSIRALRFYHESGLLEPSHVDPSTNYRSYEPKQLRELQDIRLYKALRFSLAEIRQLLHVRPSPSEMREILRERRAFLKQRVEDDLGCLARIEEQLHEAGGESNQADWRVERREIQPVWVAASREKIRSYEEAEDLFAEIEYRVPPELVVGKRAALWHTCANDGPQIDCEALRFLKRPASPIPGIRVYEMPAARVVSLFHTGSEHTVPQAYGALYAWLGKNNFVSRGPKCEIYWIEPGKRNDKESLTEIRLPVFPSDGRRHAQRRAA
jgi:DNA-binding transcriptional MerR regulator